MRPLKIAFIAMQALEDLLKLPEAVSKRLLEQLTTADPSGDIHYFMNQLDSDVAVGADRLFAAFYPLQAELTDATPDQFLRDLRSILTQRFPNEPEEKFSIIIRMLDLLFTGQGGIGLSVKANDLLTEHERNFARARIITDIRPLYPVHDTSNPSAAVVSHNLKIQYSKKVGTRGVEVKDFYVGLDNTDLLELRSCIDRALQKSVSLERMIANCGITFVRVASGLDDMEDPSVDDDDDDDEESWESEDEQ